TAPAPREWDGASTQPRFHHHRRVLRRRMLRAIRHYLDSQHAMIRRLRHAPRVPMSRAGTGDMAGFDTRVHGIAGQANDAVSATFGGDTRGAALTATEETGETAPLEATGANRTLFDQNDLHDLEIGMDMDAAGLARDAVDWIGKSTPACQALLS